MKITHSRMDALPCRRRAHDPCTVTAQEENDIAIRMEACLFDLEPARVVSPGDTSLGVSDEARDELYVM